MTFDLTSVEVASVTLPILTQGTMCPRAMQLWTQSPFFKTLTKLPHTTDGLRTE